MKGTIRDLRKWLETLSDKDIDALSSDMEADKYTKEQVALVIEVATYLLDKDTFTEKEITPYTGQAATWFILEKLRREGLVKIDDKGVPHRTKLGLQVAKHLEDEKKC